MIVIETLARRWWALAFIPVFFWAATAERSWLRALRFLSIAAVVSFAAEYSSTRNGFPYGGYTYIAPTHGQELYISNIPLFVPLTFGVVVWAGRALAQRGARWRFVLSGALAATIIDLVIDPMTLRGDQWFLSALYQYKASGGWFDVPWSNAAGWVLVSVVVLGLDGLFEPPDSEPSHRGIPLAAGTCAFFILVALTTRNYAIAAASAAVTAALFGTVWLSRTRALPGPRGTPRSPS